MTARGDDRKAAGGAGWAVAAGAGERALALSAERLARVPPGPEEETGPGRFTPLTGEDRDRLAAELLARNAGRPFWLFAYGSLIWKPAFEHVEARRATVHGWRRAFCMDMLEWRATPERPGLMMALDRGGACVGVAYRMPDDDPHGRMLRLLEREVPFAEMTPWLRWVAARAGGETLRALAFYCAPPRHEVLLRLPLVEQAARIARAAGPAGSCAEYLLNTVAHLEALGVHDRYLWRLQELVAAEIDAGAGG